MKMEFMFLLRNYFYHLRSFVFVFIFIIFLNCVFFKNENKINKKTRFIISLFSILSQLYIWDFSDIVVIQFIEK